jgi:phospholipase C
MKPLPLLHTPLRTATLIHAPVSRRRFLKAGAGIAAGITLGGLAPSARADDHNRKLPRPQHSGLDHIVVVMMENRSFDHFLGWMHGAEGRQEGLSYTDSAGISHPTWALTGDYQGCSYQDPDHSYQGGRVEYNGGACDGWLRADNDIYAIGYYTRDDLDFLRNAANTWTVLDHYFAAIMAETFPNRIYQHAAQTDRFDNSLSPFDSSLSPFSTLPTIWDRLADKGLSGRYYYSDIPLLALWGTKYLGISRPIADFFANCAAGTLPDVSFVDPRFVGEAEGTSGDDHPHGDIRDGEAFLNSVYQAVTASPNWPRTALVINYDEWGGFFDHIPPSAAPIPPADAALGSDGLRGFRVPALLISPWSPRHTVAHGIYDHTSVLKMIEWRWGLRPLTVRDASANNLAEVLDFAHPRLKAPAYRVPAGPFGAVCPGSSGPNDQLLLDFAAALGFPPGH